MAKEYSDADDTVGFIAKGLIGNYHPELAEARILYIFVSEASKKGGVELYGRVKKVSGFNEWYMEVDFIIEVAADKWNELDASQRTALVDHLLERCTGEENEKTGEMSWKIREPDVQEFESILNRHGAWHSTLAGFVSVAQKVNMTGLIEEEEQDLNDEVVETTEESAEA